MGKQINLLLLLSIAFALISCSPVDKPKPPMVTVADSLAKPTIEVTTTLMPMGPPTDRPTLASTTDNGSSRFSTVTPSPVIPTATTEHAENQRRIAFTSDRDGNCEVYVMNLDGSNQIDLTNHPSEDLYPAWSPDGQTIAFISNRNAPANGDCDSLRSSIYEIFAIHQDGTELRQITTGIGGIPVWSPDGTQIAFSFISPDEEGMADIYLVNVDGTNLRNLTNHPSWNYNPNWNPNGTKIAFNSSRDLGFGSIYASLYVMYTDDANLVLFPDVDGNNVQWSPDGEKLAFTSRRHEVAEGLFVANSDFTNLRQITESPRHEELPSWSPDGKWLAYIYLCNYQCQIRLINLTNYEDFLLIEVPSGYIESLVWTPDSEQIIISADVAEKKVIYAIQGDGSRIIDLSNSLGSNNYQPSVQL